MVKKPTEKYTALLAPVVLVAMFTGFTITPSYAQANTFTQSIRVFIDEPHWINNGLETLHVSGYIQYLYRVTELENGYVSFGYHETFQGLTAIGETTGQKYQVIGGTNRQDTLRIGTISSGESHFMVLGQGRGNDLVVYYNSHFVLNPNGEVTVFIDNVRFR